MSWAEVQKSTHLMQGVFSTYRSMAQHTPNSQINKSKAPNCHSPRLARPGNEKIGVAKNRKSVSLHRETQKVKVRSEAKRLMPKTGESKKDLGRTQTSSNMRQNGAICLYISYESWKKNSNFIVVLRDMSYLFRSHFMVLLEKPRVWLVLIPSMYGLWYRRSLKPDWQHVRGDGLWVNLKQAALSSSGLDKSCLITDRSGFKTRSIWMGVKVFLVWIPCQAA